MKNRENWHSDHVEMSVYRSLIEHFLRHNYLFFRFIREKKDAVGEEYSDLADIKEYFDFFRAANAEQKIFEGQDQSEEFNEYIYSRFPKYKKISKKELRNKLSQFTVKSMIGFIWENLKKSEMEPAVINNLLTDYSILSSFVHGGPHANRLMMHYAPNIDDRTQENLKLCRQSYFLTTYIKMNTYIVAGQYNPYFLKFVQKLKEYALKLD